MRPAIGITTRAIPPSALGAVPPGVADVPLYGVFSEYCESVDDAGGLALMLSRSSDPASIVTRVDGLILSGGEDVEPQRYGSEPDPAIRYDPERDEFELALASAALEAGVPILAICRGCQLLNVAIGGTLVPELPTASIDHSWTELHRSERRHGIAVVPGTLLASVLASELRDHRTSVNSYHHQAIAEPGRGAAVTATAPDGTIEALELPGRDVLGVQWHPEMHAGTDPVFTWLVGAAGRYAKERTR